MPPKVTSDSDVSSVDIGRLVGAGGRDFTDGIGTPDPDPRNLRSTLVFLT